MKLWVSITEHFLRIYCFPCHITFLKHSDLYTIHTVLLKISRVPIKTEYVLCKCNIKVKQSRYRPGGAQRVPGS